MGSNNHEFDEDPIVRDLVPDPSDLQDYLILTGFVGRSNKKNHLRVYLDAELSEYLELRENDCLRREPFTLPLSPIQASILWVKRDAELEQIKLSKQTIQGEFLQGGIAAKYAAELAGSTLATSTTGERGPIVSLIITAWGLCCTKYRPASFSCADNCTENLHITPASPC